MATKLVHIFLYFFVLIEIFGVCSGKNLANFSTQQTTLPIGIGLNEEAGNSLPPPPTKSVNVSSEKSIVILNLSSGATIILVKEQKDGHHGYSFKCQGQQVTSFGGSQCDSLNECHRLVSCLEEDDQHDLEDCSKMDELGDDDGSKKSNKFFQGEACTKPETNKIGQDMENCLSFFVPANSPAMKMTLSSIVQCSHQNGADGQEVYHYMAGADGKIGIQRIPVQTSESGSSKSKKINFKSRNYPGENKIYSSK